MVDEADIRQCLGNGRDRVAFELIVDRFQDKVFHLALSLTRNHATASDLSQEVFLRVWKALPTYNGTASLSTWIYTICRNVCLTEISRSRRRNAISLDAPDSTGTVERLVAPEPANATAGLDLEVMLSQLNEHHQQVLRLFYLEQKSYEETAALLGQPLGTVKTNLFRARQALARVATRSGSTHHHKTVGTS